MSSASLWVHKELCTVSYIGHDGGLVQLSENIREKVKQHYQGVTPNRLASFKFHKFAPPFKGNPAADLKVGDELSVSLLALFKDGSLMLDQFRFAKKAIRVQGLGVVLIPKTTANESGPWTSLNVFSHEIHGKRSRALALPSSMAAEDRNIDTGDIVWFAASRGQLEYNHVEETDDPSEYTVYQMAQIPNMAKDGDTLIPGFPVCSLAELCHPPPTLSNKEALHCIIQFWKVLLNAERMTQQMQQLQKVLCPANVTFYHFGCPIHATFTFSAAESSLNPKVGDSIRLEAFRPNDQLKPYFNGLGTVMDCRLAGNNLVVDFTLGQNASLQLLESGVDRRISIFRISPHFQDMTASTFRILERKLRMIMGLPKEKPIAEAFALMLGRHKFDSEANTPTQFTEWPYPQLEVPSLLNFVPDDAQVKFFHMLCKEHWPLSVLLGPAGCAKTMTLAAGIYRLLDDRLERLRQAQTNTKILVMAGSNKAVDVLGHIFARVHTDQGDSAKIRPVRIYASEREVAGSPCSSIALHEQKFDVQSTTPTDIIEEIEEYRRMENKLAEFSIENMNKQEISESKQHANQLVKEMKAIAKRLEIHYLETLQPNVILTTLGNSIDKRLDKMIFTDVCIDEAGQADQPELLLAATRLHFDEGRQICLVGDTKQLPPTILSPGFAGELLSVSMLDQVCTGIVKPWRLETCYRMHPSILEYAKEHIYEGKLYPGVVVEDRSKFIGCFPFPVRDIPIVFCDCQGPDEQAHGYSRHNKREIDAVSKILDCAVNVLGVKPEDIGLLTFYDEQRALLNVEMQAMGLDVEANNIDASQGKEFEMELLTCVRSSPEGEKSAPPMKQLGFLTKLGRRCVSLTRARSGLIVVGDASTLAMDEGWRAFIEFCESRGVIIGNWDQYLEGLSHYQSSDWYDGNGHLILPDPMDTSDIVPMDMDDE